MLAAAPSKLDLTNVITLINKFIGDGYLYITTIKKNPKIDKYLWIGNPKWEVSKREDSQ